MCVFLFLTVTEASMGEVLITCEKIRWTICHAENILKREYRPLAFLLAFTKSAYVEYLPLGVLGIIVPWNVSGIESFRQYSKVIIATQCNAPT